jgi:hypothetical protein
MSSVQKTSRYFLSEGKGPVQAKKLSRATIPLKEEEKGGEEREGMKRGKCGKCNKCAICSYIYQPGVC